MLAAPLSAVLHLCLLLATDPSAECTPYYYPPVAAAVAAGQFPPIRTGVTSLPSNGTEAHVRFLAVTGSVAAISLKGALAGTFSDLTPGYPLSDPDSWWRYHHCVTPKLTGLNADVAGVSESPSSRRAGDQST
ncbi:hypothetical protein B0H14DRAFT_2555832 [Mycena olivaceomarginata]|nr:hypothetical protein B0H14DRAFT_2555832 [Mycena olivaceomarginata]